MAESNPTSDIVSESNSASNFDSESNQSADPVSESNLIAYPVSESNSTANLVSESKSDDAEADMSHRNIGKSDPEGECWVSYRGNGNEEGGWIICVQNRRKHRYSVSQKGGVDQH